MNVMWIEGEAEVPAISEDLLAARVDRYTVLVPDRHDKLRRIVLPHLTKTAYLWHPEFVGGAVVFEPIREVFTDHYCGAPVFFKPSIYEVLSQVPDDLPERCNAFWIETETVECYKSGNGHRVKTIFGAI